MPLPEKQPESDLLPLTPEEQEELTGLKGLYKSSQLQTVVGTIKDNGPLTSEEQTELTYLKDLNKSSQLQKVVDTIKGGVSAVTDPIKRTWDIYNKEREAGRELVAGAIENPSWKKTPLQIALGTAQYTLSPLTAIGKGVVGPAAKETAKKMSFSPFAHVGIPDKDYNLPIIGQVNPVEMIGKLGEEAIYFIPLGGTVRGAMMAGKSYAPGLKAAEKAAAFKLPKTVAKKADDTLAAGVEKIEKPFDTGIRQAIKDAPPIGMETEGPLKAIAKPQVSTEVIDELTKGAAEALKGNFDESERIFRQLGSYVAKGEFEPKFIPEFLAKHDLTPAQFAKAVESGGSESGRYLGYLSRMRKQMRVAFKDEPEALAILEKAYKETPAYTLDKVFGFVGKAVNTWRASLTGQVATGMRNVTSQGIRVFVISALDEALQVAIKGVFSGEKFTINQMREGLNTYISAISQMKSSGRKRLNSILNANHSALSKGRLFSQPVHEVSLGGKWAHAVNTLNRTQEFFFRRVAFESKLRQLLSRKGMSFNNIDPKKIPEEMFAEATNYALEMTFAASPKTAAAQKFVKAWTESPLVLVNPFPRFNFANAVPFAFEHSPLGYLNAVKPSTLKALASGNPDAFAKAASRATLGSLFLDSALRFRQSKHAGEKWYEIKVKEKTIDVRAYAPFSTYFFIAEAIAHPERLKPADYAQAAVGLNRIAGSGLVITDWLRAETGESFMKQVQNFAGQFLSGYTVPLRTAKDVYSAFDPEENKYRDYRESPLIAPTMLNLPKVSQMVPEKPSPTGKVEDKAWWQGLLRQMTGLTVKDKNSVQKEIDKIGLRWSSVAPRTGIARADRMISAEMAPIVERQIPALINKDVYKSRSNEVKQILLSDEFGRIRAAATQSVSRKFPELGREIKLGNLPKNFRKMFEKRTTQ